MGIGRLNHLGERATAARVSGARGRLGCPLAGRVRRGEQSAVGSAGCGSTVAVGSYPANGYGLHDMAGDVWEWTDDWWVSQHGDQGGCCVPREATRTPPTLEGSYDPAQPQFRVPRKVIKGGSFLCADSHCHRYRPAARRPQMIDTGMSHVGFRWIRRVAGQS